MVVAASAAKSPENIETEKANSNIVIKPKVTSDGFPDERRAIVSTPKRRNMKKLDAQLQKGITIGQEDASVLISGDDILIEYCERLKRAL